jgi:hypothetical protein
MDMRDRDYGGLGEDSVVKVHMEVERGSLTLAADPLAWDHGILS